MSTFAQCPPKRGVEFLEEHAEARAELRQSSYAALRHVACRVIDGRIVLCGRVPSFYLKQVAQCLLVQRLGTRIRLENRLEVTSGPLEAASLCE